MIPLNDVNGITNSLDPDQTAPLGNLKGTFSNEGSQAITV